MNISCLLIGMIVQGFSISGKNIRPLKTDNSAILLSTGKPSPKVSLLSNEPILRSDTSTCSIPFTMAGKLILVAGTADTVSGSFILDTGAPGLVLNSTYFRDYPLEHLPAETQESITGQGEPTMITDLHYFRLGTFHYYRLTPHVTSLSHLENSKGTKILGLLGVGMFTECEMIIDYKTNTLHLHHIKKNERKTYAHPMLLDATKYETYPFELNENRILVNTQISGKKLPFVVDYGAESNIIDSRLPDKILDFVDVNGRIVLSGAGTQKVEAVTGDLSGFSVGTVTVEKMAVIVTNLENTCFGKGNCIQGVLGHEFLSRYTIVFNFVKRKMYIFK